MPIFIPGRQKTYFDDPFAEDDPLEGVRDMNTGEVPEWITALGNKATPAFRPEKNDMPDMPDMPSMSDPFEGIPETSRPKSTLRTQIEELIKRRPQIDEKPSIAKAIAAGLFGGVQGYLNTSPAHAVHQDPKATDEFVKALKMGNYDAKDRNWGNQLKDLELMDTLEGRDRAEAVADKRAESDEALKKAQAEYYKQRPGIEDKKIQGAEKRAVIRAGETTFGSLPEALQKELNAGKPEDQQFSPDDILPKFLVEQINKIHNYGQMNQAKKDIAAGHDATKITTTDMNNQTSTANTQTKVGSQEKIADKRVAGQKDAAAIRANAPAKERPVRAGEAEAEHIKLTSRAENDYQREIDRLDRQFGIGTTGYPAVSSPDKLKPEAKASYMSKKNSLDAALAKKKADIANLANTRRGQAPARPSPSPSKPQSPVPQSVLDKVPEGGRFRSSDGAIYRKVNGKAVAQ